MGTLFCTTTSVGPQIASGPSGAKARYLQGKAGSGGVLRRKQHCCSMSRSFRRGNGYVGHLGAGEKVGEYCWCGAQTPKGSKALGQ